MDKNAFLAISALPLLAATACSKNAQRPNIIFFLVDDFGWTDTQVAFGPEVYPQNSRHNTPNFLQMASEGAILTIFTSGASNTMKLYRKLTGWIFIN